MKKEVSDTTKAESKDPFDKVLKELQLDLGNLEDLLG